MDRQKPKGKARSQRADGRRPFLAYLEPSVIKALKKAALDDDRSAYQIAEEAIRNWLLARKPNRSKGGL
jgi:hypothetical protein